VHPVEAQERTAGPTNGGRPLDYDHDNYDDYDDYDEGLNTTSPDATPPPPTPAAATSPAPMPATINLVVPAGTLLGWDTTPAEVGGWGLLDSDETRTVVAAASRHPATRWCVTVTGADGTALAHGCSPGQHHWTQHAQSGQNTQGDQTVQGDQHSQGQQHARGHEHARGSQGAQGSDTGTSPPGPVGPRLPTVAQAARLSEFLRRLNATLTPITQDTCDHTQAEPGYTPSRKLKHLIRARMTTCDAPGCAAQAIHADLDHTTPHPDGPTDQCNLSPKCRRHHKVKQAPDWKAEQPQPGVTRWTLPSGRTHVTTPTVYDITGPTAHDITSPTGFAVNGNKSAETAS
jgi:hypothetical protein